MALDKIQNTLYPANNDAKMALYQKMAVIDYEINKLRLKKTEITELYPKLFIFAQCKQEHYLINN